MLLSTIFYCLIPLLIIIVDVGICFLFNNLKFFQSHYFPKTNNKFICFFATRFHNKEFLSRLVFSVTVVLILAAICGFRSVSVGADTKAYFDFYSTVNQYSFEEIKTTNFTFERGFVILAYLFAIAHIPYYVFSFVVYFYFFVVLIIVCQLYSKMPSLTLALYVCFGFFALNLSTIRQTLAFSFCLLSLIPFALIKNRYLKFISVLIVFVGYFFHSSVILFVFVYLFYFIKIKTTRGALILFLSFAVSFCFFAPIGSYIFLSISNPTNVYSFYPPALQLSSISGTSILLIIVLVLYIVLNIYYFDFSRFLSFSFIKFSNDKFFQKISISTNMVEGKTERMAFSMTFFQLSLFMYDQIIFLLSRAGLYGCLGFCLMIPKLLDGYSKGKQHIFTILLVTLFGTLYFYFTVLRVNYLNLLPYGVF